MPPAAAENFPPYYTQDQLLDAHVIKGTLHVNGKCPSDAFVKTLGPYMLPDNIGLPEACLEEAMSDDIFIRGAQDRNRALQGDIVYVIIKPVSKWNYDRAMMDKEHRYDDGEEKKSSPLPGIPCGKVVYIVDRANLPIFCVLRSQYFSANMSADDELIFDPQRHQQIRAIPLDRRFPWFLIDVGHFLEDFGNLVTSGLKRTETPDGEVRETVVKLLPEYTAFKIKLKDWRTTDKLPKGIVLEKRGECLSCEFETAYALETNTIGEFADPIPEKVQTWATSRVEEIQKNFKSIAATRKDLRHLNVISIDPATARDLDDACHIRPLSDEEIKRRGGGHKRVFEVGVHIADVSFVIPPGSPPDIEGSKRTTTVYLPHKAFHMLPRSICQDLCSLNAESDKLAYSVIAYFDMDTLELINNGTQWKGKYAPQFFKSVIRNKSRLNYDQVQDLLDRIEKVADAPQAVSTLVDQADVKGKAKSIETSMDYPISKLTEDIRAMFHIARKLRNARFREGSVNLNKIQLRFHCDSNALPETIVEEVHSESHWLIEEWMLLANQLVAQRLYSSPVGETTALLRVHAPIDPKKRSALLQKLSSMGVPATTADFTTPGAMTAFLKNLYKTQSPRRAMMVEQLVIMSLEQAHYEWAAPEKYTRHFALGFELYTHFTSPIRRYADLLVHRQLELVVRYQNDKNAVDELLAELLKLKIDPHSEKGETRIQDRHHVTEADEKDSSMLGRINTIRMCAKRAGECASNAWLLMFLLNLPEPLTSPCVVAEVCDRSFAIHLSELFSFVRIEFEVCLKGDTTRLYRRIRPEHLKKISVPESYTLLNPDGSDMDVYNLPEDGEGLKRVLEKAKVRIRWKNDKAMIIKVFEEITVWVVPSRDVPIKLIAVPVPPNHGDRSPKVAEKTLRIIDCDKAVDD